MKPDAMIIQFQQILQNTDPSVEKLDELKRSGHDDIQIAMYTRGYREAMMERAKPFYGAECPNYPNCSGGCGLGCTHEIEANKSRPSPSVSRPDGSTQEN